MPDRPAGRACRRCLRRADRRVRCGRAAPRETADEPDDGSLDAGRADRGRCDLSRRRRDPAGHRAGRGALSDAVTARARSAPRALDPRAGAGPSRCRGSSSHAERGARLGVRPALADGPGRPAGDERVRRRVRRLGVRTHLRRRAERRRGGARRARAHVVPHRRPRRAHALPPARTGPPVRRRAPRRGWRSGRAAPPAPRPLPRRRSDAHQRHRPDRLRHAVGRGQAGARQLPRRPRLGRRRPAEHRHGLAPGVAALGPLGERAATRRGVDPAGGAAGDGWWDGVGAFGSGVRSRLPRREHPR